MKVQLSTICFFLLVLVGATSAAQYASCPFKYLYHFGDGFTDVGNSIHVLPYGPSSPGAQYPYGKTFPGYPAGRWSDGITDFDYAATDFGLPHITPYMVLNASENYDGVIFSVARSPVLDYSFFESRGVNLPPYVVPLRTQMRWFKTYFKRTCRKSKDCAQWIADSAMFMGDVDGNDIGYLLTQGKSIKEVKSYVPRIIGAQMKATRELIGLGLPLVVIPGNAPLGCYPYVLTALQTDNSSAYDDLGCLQDVNDLITYKNNYLQESIRNLSMEFPNVTINYGEIYSGVTEVLTFALSGPNGKYALQSCCGAGGKYNFDPKMVCGTKGATDCPYPNQYIFWDGFHYTQQAFARIESILIAPSLPTLGCASQLRAFM